MQIMTKLLCADMRVFFFIQLKPRMSKLNVIAPGGTSKLFPHSLLLLMSYLQDDVSLGEIGNCHYHLAKCKSNFSPLIKLRA